MKRILPIAATVAVLSLFVAAQTTKTTAPADTAATPKIRQVPAPQTPASSGEANYKAYCAACHGVAGKGDGPAAPALKIPPADLSRLTANAGGKYPTMHIQEMIRNADSPAHGSKDMPIWGPVFRNISGGSQSQVELRVANLTKYIETLQAK